MGVHSCSGDGVGTGSCSMVMNRYSIGSSLGGDEVDMGSSFSGNEGKCKVQMYLFRDVGSSLSNFTHCMTSICHLNFGLCTHMYTFPTYCYNY